MSTNNNNNNNNNNSNNRSSGFNNNRPYRPNNEKPFNKSKQNNQIRQRPNNQKISIERKFQKVQAERAEAGENEIRIKATYTERKYVNRAAELLLGNSEKNIQKYDHINIQAVGPAIPTALSTSHILRSKIPGLHQILRIKTEQISDKYEPKNQSSGLEPFTLDRDLQVLEVILTYNPTEDQKKEVGYSGPLSNVTNDAKLSDLVRDYTNNNNNYEQSSQRRQRSQNDQGNQRGQRQNSPQNRYRNNYGGRNNNNNNSYRYNSNNGQRYDTRGKRDNYRQSNNQQRQGQQQRSGDYNNNNNNNSRQ